MSNFGDDLSRLVLREVTGQDVRWSTPARADVLGIGSILELAFKEGAKDCIIWGSGLRQSSLSLSGDSLMENGWDFLAVRGPLTSSSLDLDQNVTWGDPGILSPYLMEGVHISGSGHVVVPHFSTWDTVSGRALLRQIQGEGYTILPPTLGPSEMLRRLAGAEVVYSSSLHGIIVSDSFGIPAIPLKPDSLNRHLPVAGRAESNFKYNDYFASLGSIRASVDFSDLLSGNTAPALQHASELVDTIRPKITELSSNLVQALTSRLG